MKRKLIAIDLDGTTLNNQSQITQETHEVIQKIIKQGHIVSIATGRSYRTSSHFYKQLNLNTPIVNFNGAWCHKPSDRNWTNGYHKTLELQTAFSLLELKQFSNIQLIAAEALNNIYIDRHESEYFTEEMPIQLMNAEFLPFTEKHLTVNPTSVNVFTKEEALPFIEDKIVERFGDEVEVRTWGGTNPALEIVSLGIQKAMGVQTIAEYYNINRNDIIAFGDEANDYEMIQYAGHGVVMKNGINGLKEVSDDITKYTNHEEGLAKYLTEYFDL